MRVLGMRLGESIDLKLVKNSSPANWGHEAVSEFLLFGKYQNCEFKFQKLISQENSLGKMQVCQ